MCRSVFYGHGYFCRLIPKGGAHRPFALKISSYEELRRFCSLYEICDYDTIQLVSEPGTVTHTGAIIAMDEGMGVQGHCIVELVEGNGPDLFHGHKTPVRAEVGFDRCIKYDNSTIKTLPKDREIIYGALKYIGWPKHPIAGYYEFMVIDWKILFRNYQNPSSAYGII